VGQTKERDEGKRDEGEGECEERERTLPVVTLRWQQVPPYGLARRLSTSKVEELAQLTAASHAWQRFVSCVTSP